MQTDLRRTLVRMSCVAAAGLVLASCTARGPNPSGVVTLPDGTTRINAREARNAQLSSGTSIDDIPEYTGAPNPKGQWPAKSPTGQTIYRSDANLEVGSEGPYARVGG